jgi:hypothetical protein
MSNMLKKMKQLWRSSVVFFLSFLFATGTKAQPFNDDQLGVQAIYGISVVAPGPLSPKEMILRFLYPLVTVVLLIAAIIPGRRYILRQKEKRVRIMLWVLLAMLFLFGLCAILFLTSRAIYWY